MTQLDPLLPEAQVDPDSRPAVDWASDPWDATDQTGSIERLRGERRTIKWIVWASMAAAVVAILIAGAVGWWYLGKINPEGCCRRRAELHGPRGGRPRDGGAATGRRRPDLRPGDLRVVRGARRRSRTHPRLLRDPSQRSHGQRARAFADATGPDLHQGHVSRRVHPEPHGRPARQLGASLDRRGLHGGRHRRFAAVAVPAARDHVARGHALSRHLSGLECRERGAGHRADDRA